MTTTARDTGYLVRPCTKCRKIYVAKQYFDQHCEVAKPTWGEGRPTNDRSQRQLVLDQVGDVPVTAGPIAERLGISLHRVSNVLCYLVRKGEVARVGFGRYRRATA